MNHCSEESLEITRIEAYKLDQIVILPSYIRSRTIPAAKMQITGTPTLISLRQQTARPGSNRAEDDAGPYFTNSLSWQSDDTSPETMAQIADLENNEHHFIYHLYGGGRRLLYNGDGFGQSFAQVTGGEEEGVSISISMQSRMPTLMIIEN